MNVAKPDMNLSGDIRGRSIVDNSVDKDTLIAFEKQNQYYRKPNIEKLRNEAKKESKELIESNFDPAKKVHHEINKSTSFDYSTTSFFQLTGSDSRKERLSNNPADKNHKPKQNSIQKHSVSFQIQEVKPVCKDTEIQNKTSSNLLPDKSEKDALMNKLKEGRSLLLQTTETNNARRKTIQPKANPQISQVPRARSPAPEHQACIVDKKAKIKDILNHEKKGKPKIKSRENQASKTKDTTNENSLTLNQNKSLQQKGSTKISQPITSKIEESKNQMSLIKRKRGRPRKEKPEDQLKPRSISPNSVEGIKSKSRKDKTEKQSKSNAVRRLASDALQNPEKLTKRKVGRPSKMFKQIECEQLIDVNSLGSFR